MVPQSRRSHLHVLSIFFEDHSVYVRHEYVYIMESLNILNLVFSRCLGVWHHLASMFDFMLNFVRTYSPRGEREGGKMKLYWREEANKSFEKVQQSLNVPKMSSLTTIFKHYIWSHTWWNKTRKRNEKSTDQKEIIRTYSLGWHSHLCK